MKPIAITGMGCISPLGAGVAATWSAMAEGRSAIAPLSGFEETDLKPMPAAQVADFDPAAHFEPARLGLLDRHSQFALVAAREAAADAGLEPEQIEAMAAVVGSGCGGKETDELTYQRLYQDGKSRVHPFTIPRGMPSAASSQVSMALGIRGPSFTVASACASAHHAIAQAALMVRSGLVERALAGGTDAPFTYGLLKSWEALRVVAPDTCRPFCADRKGMVLGEGAGMVVLESVESAQARGARIHALLLGVGMSADAAHITDPDSKGATRAMRAALEDADRPPEAVGYINAHGTGTRLNDPSETRAIREVFGAHAEHLKISSTKSMHGHALGAAGAIELVATVKALKTGILPPTAHFTTADPECDLDYIPNRPVRVEVECALSNAFAFGGLNAVLLLARAP